MKKMHIAFVFLLVLVTSKESFGQWVQINPNLQANCFEVSGTNIFAGSYGGGVFLSTDNGESWNPVNNGLDLNVTSLAVSGSNIFAGTLSGATGGVYLSTDNGNSWTPVNNGLYTDIVSLAVFDTNLFAGTWEGVYLSTNNGANWAFSGLGLESITEFASSGSNLFAGGYGLYLSTNNGTTWTESELGMGISDLAVSGTNIFAGTESGIYLSTDDGTSWKQANNGLTNWFVLSLAVSGINTFTGTKGGVFLSTNNGTDWKEIGLTNYWVFALFVSGTNLFAGTYGAGIWRRPLSEVITALDDYQATLPTKYALSQNYPNPFNPTTVINYSVPKQSFVTIKVFDILGREVITLVNEEKAAGEYSVNFNAANLGSGIYFHTMKAGSFTDTKKMVVLK